MRTQMEQLMKVMSETAKAPPGNSNPQQDLGIILRLKSDLCDSGQSLKDGITSARGRDANTTQHGATCM